MTTPHPEQAEPKANFSDPRVQRVYEILCSDERPPAYQHWEGWTARRIVDALFTARAALAALRPQAPQPEAATAEQSSVVAAEPACALCNGAGELFVHAADCDDDLCALNGDEHSCVGQVVRCECQPHSLQPEAAEPVPAPVQPLYVACRECVNCDHIGINDDSDTDATCNYCGWTGPSPIEDICPGCDRDGTMTASCPKCGGQYVLLAETKLSTTTPPVESVERDAARRYEFVRKLSPRQFADLWQRNVAGEGQFDALVDAALAEQQP